MADQRTYSCTDAQLTQLASLLAAHGVTVDLTGPGHEAAEGWDIQWAFPNPAHIAITVYAHPFAEEGFLWSALGRIFAG
jgi:hypothetical protein